MYEKDFYSHRHEWPPSSDALGPESPIYTGEATVQLIFAIESDELVDAGAERMWVILDSMDNDGNYSGPLDNDPYYIKD